MTVQKLTLMRLQKEEAGLDREPLDNALVAREGLLNFHFCLYNLEGPYEGGYYHGLLELHENYPFMAPKLIFYTPNGRFETNIPICTSFTNYHQETWTSAWNIRTLILATISFMYSEEPSYGCKTESTQVRKDFAAHSMKNNLNSQIFVSLFADKLRQMGKLPDHKEQKKEQKEEPKEVAKEEKKEEKTAEQAKEEIKGQEEQQRQKFEDEIREIARKQEKQEEEMKRIEKEKKKKKQAQVVKAVLVTAAAVGGAVFLIAKQFKKMI